MTQRLDLALAPVARELLAAAGREAGQRLAEAERAATKAVADAQSHVDGVLAAAREQATADAAGAAAAERARGRRDARAAVLAARRDAVEALTRAAKDAVAALVSDPDYPLWRKALAVQAHRTLGEDAVVADPPDGGVVAVAGSRRIDLRLPRFAEQAMADLGAELGLVSEGGGP